MKNLTTKEFCRKFRACEKGTRFALQYKRMSEVYNALLNGEAGENSYEWAVWTYTRAVKKKERVRFVLWCANRVRHLVTDKRCTDALNAVQRWLNGKKVDLKGFATAAYHAAYHVAETADPVSYCAANAAYHAAYAYYATVSAASAAYSAGYCGFSASAAEQIEHIRKLGNPFEEDGEDD